MSDRLKKAAAIAPGAALASGGGRDVTGAVVVPNLPTRRTLEPFGFSHLGAAGGGSDQYVYIGDGEGLIATGLGKAATNFDTGIGVDSNANLNKHLKHNPVMIEKVTTTVSDLAQQAKAIFYCVVNVDGEIDKVNLNKYFRADQSRSDQQTTIAIARFRGGLKLGAFEALQFYVGDTKTLEANFDPIGERN